jgi:hypothetical protein
LTGFGDDFEISAQTRALTTMTIRQGTTGTFNLAAAPDQTFTGTVNLQCPANLPTSTTCVVNPTTVTWPSAPGASQNFTAAFTTTKKTTTSSFAHPSRFPSRPVGLVALGLPTLIWVAARIAEKRSPISRSSQLSYCWWPVAATALRFLPPPIRRPREPIPSRFLARPKMPAAALPLHWSLKRPHNSSVHKYAIPLLSPYGLRRRSLYCSGRT